MNDSPVKALVATIRSQPMQDQLKASLPDDIPPDRFTAVTITAVSNNPDLINADRQSLYNAIVRAAQDGLLPDGREGAIVIFNTNVGARDQPQWIKKAQWMPMIGGIRKRLAQCGITLDAQVIHENDEFTYEFGDDSRIVHKPPKLGKPRGEMIGAYAIAKLKDGNVVREVMDRAQIEAVREQSRGKDSLMWTKFSSEAYRKTVARRAAKVIPIVDQRTEGMFKRDDEQFTFDQDGAAETEAPTQAPAAAAPPPAQRPRALQHVVDSGADEVLRPPPINESDLPPPVEAAAAKPATQKKQAPKPAPPPVSQEQENDVF